MSKSSVRTVHKIIWRPDEVWRSVVMDLAGSWIFSADYVPQHPVTCSVSLCGLPLCGWVTFIPKCFYLLLIPLTTDCKIFSSTEIAWLDFLHSCHSITELTGSASFFQKCFQKHYKPKNARLYTSLAMKIVRTYILKCSGSNNKIQYL